MARNQYQSLLVITVGLLIVGYIFPSTARYWVAAAATVGVAGLASKWLRRMILAVWEKIALVLGWINSRILLSAVFIVFLVPIAFLYRLLKGDLLFLKKPPQGSLYVERNHTYLPKDLENPW